LVYAILRVENTTTGYYQQSTGVGCPPPTSCVGPLTLKLNDGITAEGWLYNCDGSSASYSSIGSIPVNIKSGACGDPGQDLTFASTNIISDNGQAFFSVSFTVTQSIINWIQSQTNSGYRATFYTQFTIGGIGCYSSEILVNTASGYAILTVANTTTNTSAQSGITGCPPITNCAGPVAINTNNSLTASGYIYKCDGSAWTYSELGAFEVDIHLGACGTSGTDHILATATTMSGSGGQEYFSVNFTATSTIIGWINAQSKGSAYAAFSIAGVACYSSEVQLVIGTTPVGGSTRYLTSTKLSDTCSNLYWLQATETSNAIDVMISYAASGTYGWGIRVYKVNASSCTETELTNGVYQLVTRSSGGSGIQSATWTCPAMTLSGNFIEIDFYALTPAGWYGNPSEAFKTEVLPNQTVSSGVWTFNLYTGLSESSTGPYWYWHLIFGDSYHVSEIVGFTPQNVQSANGYATLTVSDNTTGSSYTNSESGCPPATNCVGPLNVSLNDSITMSGLIYQCNGSSWLYSNLGAVTVTLKSGACGDPGQDFVIATTTTSSGSAGQASYSVSITVSQTIIDWIVSQIKLGYRSSIYALFSVGGISCYSAEVQLTTSVASYTGYAVITVNDTTKSTSATSTGTGCPPPTGCVGPINVSLGDNISVTGLIYKCDGSIWKHSDLGATAITIQSGACGDSGPSLSFGTATTVANSSGQSSFSTSFLITQTIMDWITSQASSSYRSSFYAQFNIQGSGCYSSEVQITTSTVSTGIIRYFTGNKYTTACTGSENSVNLLQGSTENSDTYGS
jgi:hypothetical protein